MAWGANRGDFVSSLRRVLVAPAIFGLLVLTPAAARAESGTSEWPATAGSADWSADPSPADPQRGETSPAPEPDPVQPDPTSEDRPVAADPPPPPQRILDAAIIFPVDGIATYSAGFGAPRPGGRSHEGVDIFADKLTPVLAAATGTVSFVRNGIGTDCCVAKIRHDDGRSSLYLHLNNDTPGTDDGLGYGLAEGIEVGVRVAGGTVIGYVGDSGNAEDTPSHLHFELHDEAGVEVDPYPYLQVAQGAEPALFASVLAAAPETLPETGLSPAGLLPWSLVLLAGGAALARRPDRGRLAPRRSRRLNAAFCETAASCRSAGLFH